MKVITGVAGFIGSCMLSRLNQEGIEDIIIVDDFTKEERRANYENKKYAAAIDREDFLSWFEKNANQVDFVIHLGAKSDTTEKDWNVFLKLNLNYSKSLWNICSDNGIPFIYASSAATYGNGEMGYSDNLDNIDSLRPLNLYGKSKQDFDIWQLSQTKRPPFWAGLKFFNVYGPNEYHKGRMASVVMHAFNQIKEKGSVALFKSHREGIKDGEQLRDFVYVKDVVDAILFLMKQQPESNIYNIGTGKARSFYDLVKNIFISLDKEINIDFVPMPVDIRDKYQYYTCATMEKLKKAGYDKEFSSIEEGVRDYVLNYLSGHKYF
ncbi:MAG: ADP-glyceromanno-heptose 6-epimerase [Bacteroidales bacterium]|nr:ADP-glyceromanno-heptose 6-epimerase [Bacteroidales bacterium]